MARADRQMDPELRGVLAEAIRPMDCFADRYERAVWFAYMEPRLSRYVTDPLEREQILHHVHCEARRVDVPPSWCSPSWMSRAVSTATPCRRPEPSG